MSWLVFASAYLGIKLVEVGSTWLGMKSARKNIESHIELLKLKPSARKLSRSTGLAVRHKLAKSLTPIVAIPGIGDLVFLFIAIGRFANKKTITKVYGKAIVRIDNENLSDALAKVGNNNLALYHKAKKESGYLSVAGHSEIARQSIVTLNNLLVDANLAGIDLKNEQSIQVAVGDTAELVGSLVKEEQTGIHSNIDTYLNVVESIRKDITGKQSVFMELDGPKDGKKD